MLKNKFSVALLTGAALLSGAIGGSALLASAQTSGPSNTPVVTSSTTESATEAPESANGKADTDNVQAGPGSTLDQEQVGEHQDVGGTQSEVNEPAGSADVSAQ